MKLSVVKPKLSGIIEFRNNKQMVLHKDKYYDIVHNHIGTYDLYSLPNNTQYPKNTVKPNININELHDKDVVFTYWSVFKDGDIVSGKIVGDKFIIE